MSLEQEKQSILEVRLPRLIRACHYSDLFVSFVNAQILPKVYYELDQLRLKIEDNTKELLTYENAIEEIEKSYGNFLFSPDFFNQEE